MALVAICLACDLWANSYWQRSVWPKKAGTLAADFHNQADRETRSRITAIDESSPLAAFGAKVGDIVLFDHDIDVQRRLGTDEVIGITLFKDEHPTHLLLRPIRDPSVAQHPVISRLNYVFGWLYTYVTLAIAVAIGWRRAGSGAMRLVSFSLLNISASGFLYNLPGGAVPNFILQVFGAVVMFGYAGSFVWFSMSFPEERPLLRFAWARRIFAISITVLLICSIAFLAMSFHRLPWILHGQLTLTSFSLIVDLVTILVGPAALFWSWRGSRGPTRHKLAWISICMSLNFLGIFYSDGQFFFNLFYDPLWGVYQSAAVCLANLGLAFAILRYRLFDFGFAVNRIVVWSIVLLVASAGIVGAGRLAEPVLAGAPSWQRWLFDAVGAFLFVMMLPKVRTISERAVRSLLYQRWRDREAALQHALEEAEQLSGQDMLLAHYLAAFDLYAGMPGCAIYLRAHDICEQRACSLPGDAFDPAIPLAEADIAQVRAGRFPSSLKSSGSAGARVLPMLHRDALTGFVVMAAKPDDALYRPDEVRVLANAVQFLNLDLQAEAVRLQTFLLEEKVALELEARRQAEAATVAKSRFLAAASHDLRQPIHAQGLFLEVLSRSELTTQQHEALNSVRSAAAATSEMLDTLLDFSRIEAGVIEANPQAFPLQPLLDRLENSLAPQATAKGLVYRSRETSAVVQADPALVDLIMLNLVSNAIRYTDRGGVLVGCRSRHGRLVVEVWDTGIGIEASQHQEIFLEFRQLGNPERDRRKGLGLGLAIADGLARTLGCDLTVASRPGQGSVFSLSLPLASPDTPWRMDVASKPLHPMKLENRYILVIDDEEMVGAGMSELLRSWGCDCDAVGSMTAALVSAGVRRPDFIISDYRLREQGTGAQAIAAVRMQCGGQIPALIITGDTAPERLREASASGVPLLHKPVAPALLYRKIVESLQD